MHRKQKKTKAIPIGIILQTNSNKPKKTEKMEKKGKSISHVLLRRAFGVINPIEKVYTKQSRTNPWKKIIYFVNPF